MGRSRGASRAPLDAGRNRNESRPHRDRLERKVAFSTCFPARFVSSGTSPSTPLPSLQRHHNASLLRPKSTSLTLQRHARKHAHKGGSGAITLRTCSPPVQHLNNVASTSDVLRRRFMGRTPLEHGPSADSHGTSQIPSFAFPFPASSACARSLWFRARVILCRRTDAPIQRLPMPGTVRPFPHPEPPLLFVLLGMAPLPGN